MSNSGVEITTEAAYRHHFYRQILHEGVIDDPMYLQRAMRVVMEAADKDLAERGLERDGDGLVGRQIEVIVLTRVGGEDE